MWTLALASCWAGRIGRCTAFNRIPRRTCRAGQTESPAPIRRWNGRRARKDIRMPNLRKEHRKRILSPAENARKTTDPTEPRMRKHFRSHQSLLANWTLRSHRAPNPSGRDLPKNQCSRIQPNVKDEPRRERARLVLESVNRSAVSIRKLVR